MHIMSYTFQQVYFVVVVLVVNNNNNNSWFNNNNNNSWSFSDMALMAHAQVVTGKLEAMRSEFEWPDGTFHFLKDRKSLPKDRRDVHGKNILLTMGARTVWSCYEVVWGCYEVVLMLYNMVYNMVMFLSFLQDLMLMELSLMLAACETCPFRAEDLESEGLNYLYAFSMKTYDVPWGPVDHRLKKLCTRSFDSIIPDRCSQDYAFRNVGQIRRVFAVLKLPYIFRNSQNGSIYLSEELFLFLLTRMSSVGATITSLIENGFGHDDSYWTRGFKMIVEHIHGRWGFKVNGNR